MKNGAVYLLLLKGELMSQADRQVINMIRSQAHRETSQSLSQEDTNRLDL